ncbi:MAG: hypothetical protein J6Y88_01855, partial [Bacteroidales bacterium]|nr:hypothetical protein [Bacteroidales bacterium]
LLPEGVAETAVEGDFYHGLFVEATDYTLFAPQKNASDSISFQKVQSLMNTAIGFAWVDMSPDLQEAEIAQLSCQVPSASIPSTGSAMRHTLQRRKTWAAASLTWISWILR